MSDDVSVSHKTGRIALLCGTLIVLGFFFFLFKVGACDGCNKPKLETTPICKDEFVEIKNDGYASKHSCDPGATVEVVNSPPAPKAGIICHCAKKPETASDAGLPVNSVVGRPMPAREL